MAVMSFREANHVLWRGVRPAHDGTQIIEYKYANNNTQVLYTVPAGEVFYLCGFVIAAFTTAVEGYIGLAIYDAVPAQYRVLQYGIGGADTYREITKSYWPPLEIPATYSLRNVSGAATVHIYTNIHGWVE